MRTSDKGIDLIKRRESLKLRVYEDAGKLAVGYGQRPHRLGRSEYRRVEN